MIKQQEQSRDTNRNTNQDLSLYGIFIDGFYVNMFATEALANYVIHDRSLCNAKVIKLDRNKAFELAKDDYEVADDEDLEFTYTALKANYEYIKKDVEFLSLYKEIEIIV